MTVTGTNPRPIHPPWCDRTDCTAVLSGGRGSHASKVSVLTADRYEAIEARVRLVQDTPVHGCPDSDPVLVELRLDFVMHEADAEDEPVIVVLRGERARALGGLLDSAGRTAA
jgi:hypothetical protein